MYSADEPSDGPDLSTMYDATVVFLMAAGLVVVVLSAQGYALVCVHSELGAAPNIGAHGDGVDVPLLGGVVVPHPVRAGQGFHDLQEEEEYL